MKAQIILALASGFGLGALTAGPGIVGAQSSGPAYVIEENDVFNADTFREYASKVPPTLQAFGGRYVVRGGRTAAFEGDPPKRIVVLAFDSIARAQAWYQSGAYQDLKSLREKAMRKRSFAVEGLP